MIPMVVPVVAVPSAVAPTVDFLGGAFLFGLASYLSITTVERVNDVLHGYRCDPFGHVRDLHGARSHHGVLRGRFDLDVEQPVPDELRLRKGHYWLELPTHVLVTAGFFMLLLFETGKLPTESHGLSEFGMSA